VTFNLPQPNAHPAGGNSVSAGTASDIKTFVAAALLPYGGGMLVLVGYLLLDGVFGGFLGLIVAVLGAVWWRNTHDKKFFPRDLPAKSMVILVVVDIVLTGLTFLLTA
jgi:hypothetical protein